MSNTKKISKPLIIAAAAVAVIVIIIAAVSGGAKTVDLAEYTEIIVDGYNGYATAKVDFEYSDLEEFILYGDGSEEDIDEMDDEDFEASWERLERLEEYLDTIEYELNKEEEISNGDKLEVTFTWSEEAEKLLKDEFKIKLEAGKEELTVEGLEDAVAIDPFEYIEVDFKGVTGYAETDVHVIENLNEPKDGYIVTADPYDDDYLRINYTETQKATIKFTVSKHSELSNNEKIKVYAEAYGLEDGMILARTEKEYTVKAVEAFKTEAELKENFDKIKAYAEKEKYLDQVTEIGRYYVTAKSDEAAFDNMAIIIYRNYDEWSLYTYYAVIAKNCYKDADGNITAYQVWSDGIVSNDESEAFKAAEAEINANYYTYTKG